MILYSHRGNTNGPNPKLENTPDYIDKALAENFFVEIDIWCDNKMYFLGHDGPENKISFDWLQERKNKLVIHAKNFKAFSDLTFNHLNRDSELSVFFHEKDKYSLVHNARNKYGIIVEGIIWAHDINNVNSKCILPLISKEQLFKYKSKKQIWGICSDYVKQIK